MGPLSCPSCFLRKWLFQKSILRPSPSSTIITRIFLQNQLSTGLHIHVNKHQVVSQSQSASWNAPKYWRLALTLWNRFSYPATRAHTRTCVNSGISTVPALLRGATLRHCQHIAPCRKQWLCFFKITLHPSIIRIHWWRQYLWKMYGQSHVPSESMGRSMLIVAVASRHINWTRWRANFMAIFLVRQQPQPPSKEHRITWSWTCLQSWGVASLGNLLLDAEGASGKLRASATRPGLCNASSSFGSNAALAFLQNNVKIAEVSLCHVLHPASKAQLCSPWMAAGVYLCALDCLEDTLSIQVPFTRPLQNRRCCMTMCPW